MTVSSLYFRFSYSPGKTEEMLVIKAHEGSCRKLMFTSHGEFLYTAGGENNIGIIT